MAMIVGVPSEIKTHEYRVGLVPSGVSELVRRGHTVFIETGAGKGVGFDNSAYEKVGASILPTAEKVFAESQLIIKVKEPQPEECRRLRPEHTLFTFLHLAPDPEQAALLKASGCMAIAYETVTDAKGGLPLLAPMSEVAGRMSIQAGASCLEKAKGGSGILLGGVPGVSRGKVVILGGGVVGAQAARMAAGLEAQVTIFDRSLPRLRELDQEFQGRVETLFAKQALIEERVSTADLVIGAVLVVGAAAPRLVTRPMLRTMRPGSVLVDVAIDQGGCFETSHPTTHANPTFVEEEIVHYCVANMPGAVARTATFALTNATLPFALNLADKGTKAALLADAHLCHGLNVCRGQITHAAVAEALGEQFHTTETALKAI